MSSKIRDIIKFFSKNDVSEHTKQRIWHLLTKHRNNTAAEIAYKELWKEAEIENLYDIDIDKAYRKLSNKLNIDNKKKPGSSFNWFKIAAVLVPLFIIIGATTFFYIRHQTSKNSNIAMLQKYTALRDTALITLSDGSRVILQEGSVLFYPPAFEKKCRTVYLVGKATFEVIHDEKSPLKVITPYFEITDLGTVFDVTAYSNKEETIASVSSGEITLQITGSNKLYNMTPDDMLVYNVSTGKVLTGKKEELSQKWKRTQLRLDNASFAETIESLSKNYDVTIDVRNHKYDDIHVTIHFNHGETIENAMRIISSIIPNMKYKIVGKNIIIE